MLPFCDFWAFLKYYTASQVPAKKYYLQLWLCTWHHLFTTIPFVTHHISALIFCIQLHMNNLLQLCLPIILLSNAQGSPLELFYSATIHQLSASKCVGSSTMYHPHVLSFFMHAEPLQLSGPCFSPACISVSAGFVQYMAIWNLKPMFF